MRWSSPGTRPRRGVVSGTRKVRESVPAEPRPATSRLGPHRGAVVDALEDAGGVLTLRELCDVLHRARPRDLRRRLVGPLEDAGVVAVEGETVQLVGGWAERLEEVRAADGEIEREDLERERHRRQREAYHRRQAGPDLHPANCNADGFVEDLEPPDLEPEPELVGALRRFLYRNPHRRREEPSWIAVAVWADGYVEGKPAPAEISAALEELGGARYGRGLPRRTKGAA